jgi:hypothetical protein
MISRPTEADILPSLQALLASLGRKQMPVGAIIKNWHGALGTHVPGQETFNVQSGNP